MRAAQDSGIPYASPERVGAALLELADTVGDEFQLSRFLHRLTAHCRQLLDTDGVGVMLADPGGALRLLAASSEDTRRLGMAELEDDDGPCLEVYRSGNAITHTGFDPAGSRWSNLAAPARVAGFRGCHAVPMRHRNHNIGVLSLIRRIGEPLPLDQQRLAQTLADIATIGLLQRRALSAHRTTADQLQQAFTSRLAVEQAKGVLAERHKITPEQAFQRLRRHARNTNQKLHNLAQAILDGAITLPEQSPPKADHTRRFRR
ncbi:GAF and ANTAR domain-containing protein [Actinoplanes sp. NPDC023936]|uniref:GAF and ANTAR domain-containing protein n=1 Tax=Actinoplanes sp. NPDC023936 TaxID=3154910 RepID=UPI003400451D